MHYTLSKESYMNTFIYKVYLVISSQIKKITFLPYNVYFPSYFNHKKPIMFDGGLQFCSRRIISRWSICRWRLFSPAADGASADGCPSVPQKMEPQQVEPQQMEVL